ncbi:MAG: T9SS type A sorting domain-containing protein [Bacteroidota bacterium]|nr:T9SS type A sorting domain-containing protein [Bacteroidota bacterium]
MKLFYSIVILALCIGSYQSSTAQVGPNLLGAKGTFSTPYITPNTSSSSSASCTKSGAATYSPVNNIGNALSGCSSGGSFLPCSDYTYVYKSGGLGPEFTYTIIKNVGDANGGNCIKGDWRGKDHTGDGGYFMAVNGAPNNTKSALFYQIKSIPVCIGTTYEFSAWVLNILPSSSSAATPGSEPNISFKVNGSVIATSGPIAYTSTPTWVKVGGTFTATTNTVDLQVVNATAVANGNDLGLDDISINVTQSNIAIKSANGSAAPNNICDGTSLSLNYIVTDVTHANTWYKWKKSIDGGVTFVDSTSGQQATFIGDSYTLPLSFSNVSSSMNGYKYRLVVSTSQSGLSNADCRYFNEYTLIVNSCGPTPVILSSFNGRYSDGTTFLDWQTSQEINSDHFDLFRSTDGQDFSLVTSVKSAGTSYSPKNYTYQDNGAPGSQYIYYRLKQVDIDGKFVFSPIIKIAVGLKNGIEVFPNPFVNNFTTSFSASKTDNATLVLRNTIGQPVFQKTIQVNKGNNSIQIGNLPVLSPGVYYLSISNDDINYNSKLQKR